MSKISRFMTKAFWLAKNAVGGRGEVAASEGGGGFADYAVVSLHCLRVYPDTPIQIALICLAGCRKFSPIGLNEADFLDHSVLVKAFDICP